MKVLLKKSFIFLAIFIAICYLASSISGWLKPVQFPYFSIIAFPFPFFFIALIVCIIILFFVYKKLAVLLLILLPVGWLGIGNTIAVHFPKKWDNSKNSTTLRILTWNVMNFDDLAFQGTHKSNNRIGMLKLIENYQPDIICFQEYKSVENGKRRTSVRRELDSIGYHYYFVTKDLYYLNPKNGREIIGGVAIFSKTPLADTLSTPIRFDNVVHEHLCKATVQLKGKPINIYTAHLASYALGLHDSITIINDYGNDTTIADTIRPDMAGRLARTEKLHYDQIALINTIMQKDTTASIFCGDINTTPGSYNYRFFKGEKQDAFLQKGFGFGTTYNKLLATLRIDVCFADQRFEVLQCKVPSKMYSDHYPVVTDIRWK